MFEPIKLDFYEISTYNEWSPFNHASSIGILLSSNSLGTLR